MTWLVYAITGMTIWSLASIGDKFFLLKHVKSKRFYVVVPATVQFIVTLPFVALFSVPHVTLSVFASAFASGVAEVVLLYYLYVAISFEEVSRVFSLTSIGPILTLVLGWFFLHETLSNRELLAFVLFLIGGLVLAAKSGSGRVRASKAIKPLLIGSIFFSGFTLLLRYAFVSSDFWAGFFYSRLGFFVGGLVVFLFFREEIVEEWHSLRSPVRLGIVGNQIMSTSGHAFYFLSISLANAALVQSVLGAQSAIILLFALIVSIWKPDILDESLEPRDLVQKGIGVAFVVAASYLLAS